MLKFLEVDIDENTTLVAINVIQLHAGNLLT